MEFIDSRFSVLCYAILSRIWRRVFEFANWLSDSLKQFKLKFKSWSPNFFTLSSIESFIKKRMLFDFCQILTFATLSLRLTTREPKLVQGCGPRSTIHLPFNKGLYKTCVHKIRCHSVSRWTAWPWRFFGEAKRWSKASLKFNRLVTNSI